MEKRTLEKIGKGGNSLVFESKKETQDQGLVLKFYSRELSEMIDVILGKKDFDKLLKVKKLLKEKDPIVLEKLDEVKDDFLKKEIIDYFDGASNLDKIMNLVEQYLYKNKKNIFEKYNENINRTRKDYDNVSNIFGKENVLGIKVLKINKENINKIDEKDTIELLNKIRSLLKKDLINNEDFNKIKDFIAQNDIEIPIIIQEKFISDNKKDIIEFNSSIPIYNKNFESILQKDQLKNNYKNIKNELERFLFENKLYALIDVNSEIKELVSDFIKKTIKYTKETHEYIDFFGQNNILFYIENDVYKYKLLDPVIPMNFYSENKNIKNINFKDFLDKNKHEIRHFYVYLKTLNIFSKKLGIKEKLNPEDLLGNKIKGVEKEVNEFLE